MEIKFTAIEERYKPTKADNLSAGLDLKARLNTCGSVCLLPGIPVTIPTGLKINIPEGYEGQVRGRSGLWFKKNVTIGQEGTIDAGYLGEIGVRLLNLGTEPVTILDGERIAQIVFNKLPEIEMTEVTADEFSEFTSERGAGGFGHSGRM